MPKLPEIKDVTSGYGLPKTINENFQQVLEAFKNTVSRDGSTPNFMSADFDMNSNDILNAGTIYAENLNLKDTDLQHAAEVAQAALEQIQEYIEIIEKAAIQKTSTILTQEGVRSYDKDYLGKPIGKVSGNVVVLGGAPFGSLTQDVDFKVDEETGTITFNFDPADQELYHILYMARYSTSEAQAIIEGIIDAVKGAGLTYLNRAAAVASLSALDTRVNEVKWITSSGIVIGVSRSVGSTAIPDMPGWRPSGEATPEHWGAVGNGSADDTDSVRRAISYASGRTTLRLRTGATYGITSRISLPNAVRIEGYGVTLKALATFNTSTGGQFFYASGRSDVHVEGLSFDGSAIHLGGVWFSNCDRVSVTNCRSWGDPISTVQRYGVALQNCRDAVVSKNEFFQLYYGVFGYGGGENHTIEGNKVYGTKRFCIVYSDDSVYVKGITIRGNYLNGIGSRASIIYIGASQNSAQSGLYESVVVDGNTCIGADESFVAGNGNGDLLSLRGMKYARVSNNFAINGGDLGIVIEISKDVTVTGNIVERNEISGIVVHGSTRVVVTGNLCVDNCMDRGGVSSLSAIRGGIRVMAGSSDVTIVGNRCTDTRSGSRKTQLWGIALSNSGGTISSIHIGDNYIQGNKIGTIYVDSGLNPRINCNSRTGSVPTADMCPPNWRHWSSSISAGLPRSWVAIRYEALTCPSGASSGSTEIELSSAANLNTNSRLIVFSAVGAPMQLTYVSKIGNTVTVSPALAYDIPAGAFVGHTQWRVDSVFPSP